MSNVTLSEKISQSRKQLNLTQEQLAEKLSVSAQAVSKWETGITSPDISLLPLLAKIFSMSVDELLGVDRIVSLSDNKDTSKLMLRVRVLSSSGDKVNINLPFKLAVMLISAGNGIASFGDGATNQALESVDWTAVSQAIEMGVRGKVVEVISHDGDQVEIVVE